MHNHIRSVILPDLLELHHVGRILRHAEQLDSLYPRDFFIPLVVLDEYGDVRHLLELHKPVNSKGQ